MPNLNQLIEEIEKQFDKIFGFEEIEVCQRCGHSKESHYWNGGGRIESSGYDACRVKGCDCEFLSQDCNIEKIPVNQEFKKFLRQSLTNIAKATVEEIVPKKREKTKFSNDLYDALDDGFNQAIQAQEDKIKEFYD